MRRQMNFQSTSIGRSATTLTTQRDVTYAHGQIGSQKKSRSAMPPFYRIAQATSSRGYGQLGREVVSMSTQLQSRLMDSDFWKLPLAERMAVFAEIREQGP